LPPSLQAVHWHGKRPMQLVSEECCVGRLSPKPSTARSADIPQGCNDFSSLQPFYLSG
jgi:hypothetical protein